MNLGSNPTNKVLPYDASDWEKRVAQGYFVLWS